MEELRKYIDRVLGNNIRCLLPSFWWKKLFHKVMDEVESVGNTAISAAQKVNNKQDKLVSGLNIKTLNGQSILGSGDMAIASAQKPITFKLTIDADFKVVENENDKAHNKASYNKFIKSITDGVYEQLELECYLVVNSKTITPFCVSWEIAGYDAYVSTGTAAVIFRNVIFQAHHVAFDIYFMEDDVSLLPHVNNLGAEFLYYRPQAPSSMKEHNAMVYQHMKKAFLNLFLVAQSKNGDEVAASTFSCLYIKMEDYYLVQVLDALSTLVYKLTSDGELTYVQTTPYVDSEISSTSKKPVQNNVVKAYVDSKANTQVRYLYDPTSAVISPNVYTVFGNTLQTTTISLEAADSGVVNDYVIEFKTAPSGEISIDFPSDIKWANGIKPQFENDMTYQISIIRNLAVVTMFI